MEKVKINDFIEVDDGSLIVLRDGMGIDLLWISKDDFGNTESIGLYGYKKPYIEVQERDENTGLCVEVDKEPTHLVRHRKRFEDIDKIINRVLMIYDSGILSEKYREISGETGDLI